jgi:penicillin amidase
MFGSRYLFAVILPVFTPHPSGPQVKLFKLLAAALLLFPSLVPGQKQVELTGLKQRASVVRDSRGIPYIQALNSDDLFFLQGFVVASDRLWQLDLLRRLARGETAEIFGRTTIDQDIRWRRYGFARVASESVRQLGPEVRGAIEAYARGVNAYINSLNEANLPREFQILRYRPRPWEPADSLVIGKVLAEALSSTYQRDLQRLAIASLPADKQADLTNEITPYDLILYGSDKGTKPAAVNPGGSTAIYDADIESFLARDMALRYKSLSMAGLFADELAASNNWVISKNRTKYGKAILANDPHLAPSAPGIWYIAHLSMPGYKVAGVTFPGTPGIILGHNEHIAWGATNVGPDVQDLYLQTVENGKVKTSAGWVDAATRTETIRFRANPLDPALSERSLQVTETPNGPIIIESGGKSYALRWTALDPKNNEFEAFFKLNLAKNWKEFRDALRTYGGPTQNFVFADVKGNIGWQVAGAIPIRRTGDGSLPYDGATSDGDWIGIIPFEELPKLYNPPSGLIVTANQRIVGTDYRYPQISRDAAPPWRARRIYQLLSQAQDATVDSSAKVQFDDVNIPLKIFADDLVGLGSLPENSARMLSGWDGRMHAGSVTATYVNEMRNCFAESMANAFKPAPVTAIRERILYWAVRERSRRWLPPDVDSYEKFAVVCDSKTVEKLSKKYSSDRSSWVWGKEALANFPHPLAQAPMIGSAFATPRVPLKGSGQTPNVASYVSMRHITVPGDWDKTSLVIPLGQSGDPGSKHFTDQFEAWRNGRIQLFPFSPNAVRNAAVENITYVPRLDGRENRPK